MMTGQKSTIRVGAVLQSGTVADTVDAAILDQNRNVLVVDCGA